LTIELAAPERLAEATGLWDARRQREGAIDTVLERYPHALVRVGWGDPHAPAADLAWRWLPLEEATARPGPATRSARRGRATPHELDAPLGAVAPAALHAAPPRHEAAGRPTADDALPHPAGTPTPLPYPVVPFGPRRAQGPASAATSAAGTAPAPRAA